MKILKQINELTISLACEILEEGGIIVYPTDTLYGFGADATNDGAINRINLIKGRAGPLSVIAPDVETSLSWINISENELSTLKPYLGGAKTLIVPIQPNLVSTKILGIDNSLGIRIPDNEFSNNLSKRFGKPIITTSVNRSGKKPINNPKTIASEFGDKIDLLIDTGTLPESSGSTIYQYKDNNINILRK